MKIASSHNIPKTDNYPIMKNILLFFGAAILLSLQLKAQEEAIFMHYTINPILINPAAAGFNETYQLQFNARAQWTGFVDAPTTLAARYNVRK